MRRVFGTDVSFLYTQLRCRAPDKTDSFPDPYPTMPSRFQPSLTGTETALREIDRGRDWFNIVQQQRSE